MITFFKAQCGITYSSITVLRSYPVASLIRDTVQCRLQAQGVQEVRCKSAPSQKWQQSGPSAMLLLLPNRKPIEAQSAGLFQPCKWISPIPPRFVK